MDYISGSKAVAEDAMSPADILSSWGKKTGKEKTLEEHDKQFHKNGFHEGDTCKFRDKVLGESKEEDDLALERSGKPNQFEIPTRPEDIDIGTDPLEEIEKPTDPSQLPPPDDQKLLEEYADKIEKDKSYDIWQGLEDDDGLPPEDVLGEMESDDGRPGSIQDDFFSWLDSLNSNPYKTHGAMKGSIGGGPRTDSIWKSVPKKPAFSDPMPSVHFKDGTTLENGDITKFSGDAIVNAANKWMLGGGGVDGAIHRAAGPELLKECEKVQPYDKKNGFRCKTGDAKITKAGRLPCKYVIHTVGPDMYANEGNEAENLASAYRKSMQIAYANGCKSIAFPSISTGIFAYPLEEAAQIAASEIHKFQDAHPDFRVTMCITKKNMDAYKRAFAALNGESEETNPDEKPKETQKPVKTKKPADEQKMTGRKLKNPEQFKKEMLAWVAKASNDALAKYLHEHEDDDLYKDAIKIVVEEANKRSRRENGGWGGETT